MRTKKNEISCNIVIDLMPLYKEGICSDETRAFVEEHLRDCADCRRLAGDIDMNTAVPDTAVPDEIETFKKVSRKMRSTRFMKAMAVVFCIAFAAFACLNIVWLAVKYLPYRSLAKDMTRMDYGKGTGYSSTSNGYTYRAKMPGYLGFEGGFLSVEPEGTESVIVLDDGGIQFGDSKGAHCSLFIWNAESRTKPAEYGLFIETENGEKIFQLMIDSSLNYIPHEDDTPENIETARALIDANREEAAGLMRAAADKWGDALAH